MILMSDFRQRVHTLGRNAISGGPSSRITIAKAPFRSLNILLTPTYTCCLGSDISRCLSRCVTHED